MEGQKRKHTDHPDTLRDAACAVSQTTKQSGGCLCIHLSPEGRSQIPGGSGRDQVALGDSLVFLPWEAGDSKGR